MKIIECVPNFSEGRDLNKIKEITDAIESAGGITLLDVDPGADTNRTVVTIVGSPEAVIEAAFKGIKKASEIIDLRNHQGAHARMGATDVCPFVPIAGATMDDCVEYSEILGARVGKELNIPVFLYEYSASTPDRKNLANIRNGEFEGMAEKIKSSEWKPDYGPAENHTTAGATAIGARNFLIAYNVNLNTKDKKIATDISLDIREQGRNKRDKKGKFIRDENGVPIKAPGIFKSCKAVGWYIEEYGVAQISMNLTNFNDTAPHIAFDECRTQASKRGVRVTGSELVGLIPLEAMLTAGKYYLHKQKRSVGIPEKDIIHIAIKSMGLDELAPFDPQEKIIEYSIREKFGPLASMKIHGFCDELSSDSPAPGGGSVAALAGSLAASLSAMVANLTFGKKKWMPLYDEMNGIAEKSQNIKADLLQLIDKDTDAFNKVMDSFRLPQKTKEQEEFRQKAMNDAMKIATMVPFDTLKRCSDVLPLAKQAATSGNPNSVSDAGVAAEMAYAGVRGAALNVYINLKEMKDTAFIEKMQTQTRQIISDSEIILEEVRSIVDDKITHG